MKTIFYTRLSLLAFAAVLVLAGCTRAKKGDDFESADPPPIGEWTNSDEIAASNLVAHWSFEGNGNEKKTGTAPSSQLNATYTQGKKGQAVSFDYGYLAYPAIAALNSLPSYTITAWINTRNNQGVAGHEGAQTIFQMTRLNGAGPAFEWAGNITFMMENSWYPASNPSLVVKGLNVTNVNGGQSWQDTRNDPGMANPGVQKFEGGGKWVHVALVWNGTDSLFQVYGNSVKISNPPWEKRGVGQLVLFTPTTPVIGAFGTNVSGSPDPWQQPFKGQIDELRVYNKALTPKELKALYIYERQGL